MTPAKPPAVPRRLPTIHELMRKNALKLAGLTQEQVAAKWEVSQPFVSEFLAGHVASEAHEAKFAALVGMDRGLIWPPGEHRGQGMKPGEKPDARQQALARVARVLKSEKKRKIGGR